MNELIVEKLSNVSKLVLPGILMIKKVTTDSKDDEICELMPRKIVKVRQRQKIPQ